MKPLAIIFDMDDTLYFERDFAFSGFVAVAVAFEDVLGEPSVAAARMQALFDTDARRHMFNAMLAERCQESNVTIQALVNQHSTRDEQHHTHANDHDAEVAIVARMIDVYRNHVPDITLCDDAKIALLRLKGRFKLGIITDGPAVMQRQKVEALKLESQVDAIILTDELGEGHGKPDPLAYVRIAHILSVNHNQCVYVGDNPVKDFVAPNQLGWHTIRVIREHGIYREAPTTPGGEPHATIESLDDLERVLDTPE